MSKRKSDEMTVTDHLRELRNKIILCTVAFVLLFILCYVQSDKMLQYIINMGMQAGFKLGYLAPQEVLIQAIRLSGVVAFLLVLPVISFEVILFIAPAINSKQIKRIVVVCTVTSYLLFSTGFIFCQTSLLPLVYRYLYDYSNKLGAVDYVSVESYLSLLLSTTWMIGLSFELPLLTAGLARSSVISVQGMKKFFKSATIIIFIVAAFVTPPDVVSMLIVAGPLEIVYAISIVVCGIFTKKSCQVQKGEYYGKTF